MAADINSRAARLTEAQVRGGKTDVIAADYAHMASLLADAAEGDPEEETYGLFPRKGVLQVGADADITLVDMNLEWTVWIKDW